MFPPQVFHNFTKV